MLEDRLRPGPEDGPAVSKIAETSEYSYRLMYVWRASWEVNVARMQLKPVEGALIYLYFIAIFQEYFSFVYKTIVA